VPHARLAVPLVLAALAFSCRTSPPPAIDPVLASCVPPNTAILFGINLDRLRASPLYAKLPLSGASFLGPLQGADYLLLGSSGAGYVIITRGSFREAPAGAVLLAPGLAVAGPADSLRAATAQHRTGRTGAPLLLDHALAPASSSDIWVIAMGNVNLPVTGNAQNLNRLLHATEYSTLTAQLRDGVQLEATGVCATPDGARRLEETLRAMASLGAGASARQPQAAALLNAIEITRDGRTVRVGLFVPADDVEELRRFF